MEGELQQLKERVEQLEAAYKRLLKRIQELEEDIFGEEAGS
jgi:predicted nuclease with TOPRIM domain